MFLFLFVSGFCNESIKFESIKFQEPKTEGIFNDLFRFGQYIKKNRFQFFALFIFLLGIVFYKFSLKSESKIQVNSLISNSNSNFKTRSRSNNSPILVQNLTVLNRSRANSASNGCNSLVKNSNFKTRSIANNAPAFVNRPQINSTCDSDSDYQRSEISSQSDEKENLNEPLKGPNSFLSALIESNKKKEEEKGLQKKELIQQVKELPLIMLKLGECFVKIALIGMAGMYLCFKFYILLCYIAPNLESFIEFGLINLPCGITLAFIAKYFLGSLLFSVPVGIA